MGGWQNYINSILGLSLNKNQVTMSVTRGMWGIEKNILKRTTTVFKTDYKHKQERCFRCRATEKSLVLYLPFFLPEESM